MQYIYIHIYIDIDIYQASAYEKQGRATIASLIMKFRGYRHAKSHTPLIKCMCGGVR